MSLKLMCRNEACKNFNNKEVCENVNEDKDKATCCDECYYPMGGVTLRTDEKTTPSSLKEVIVNNTEGEFSLHLDNSFYGESVKVETSLEEFSANFSLAGDTGFCIEPGKDKEIKIQYKLEPDFSDTVAKPKFILVIKSWDGIDHIRFPRRNYGNNEKFPRTQKFDVVVSVEEPSKIAFEKELIPFGIENDSNEVRFFRSSGSAKISITEIKPPPQFSVVCNDGNQIDYTKWQDMDFTDTYYSFTLKHDGSLDADATTAELELSYISAGSPFVANLTVFVIPEENIWKTFYSIPDNIVAIDFGTSKTTISYINTDELLSNESAPFNLVEIPTLKAGVVGRIDGSLPSRIVLERDEYIIGKGAEGNKSSYAIESLKMHLREEQVNFVNSRGDKLQKKPSEVLTNFLRRLRVAMPEDLQNPESNLYIFTLPVLDSDKGEEAVDYNQQKYIMLKCAKEAGFANDKEDNIDFITESDAAMFYVVAAAENNKFQNSINLKPKDIIGIFDFGAGTLDVSIGEYSISGGKGTINVMYSKGWNDAGNTIDYKIAMMEIGERLERDETDEKSPSIVFDPPYDAKSKDDILHDFASCKFFGALEDKYGDRAEIARPAKDFIKSYFKPAKELFSFFTNKEVFGLDETSPYDGIPPTSFASIVEAKREQDYLIATETVYNEVTQGLIRIAADTLQKELPASGINKIDYMFMVGGSSLIKDADSTLNHMLQRYSIKAISPFHYAGFGNRLSNPDALVENAKDILEVATYAVVKGACISVISRRDKNFQYNLEIKKRGEDGATLWNFKTSNDIPFHTMSSRLPSNRASGIWDIFVGIEGSEEKITDSFRVKASQQVVKFNLNVKGRSLELSCDNGGVMTDVRTNEPKQVKLSI